MVLKWLIGVSYVGLAVFGAFRFSQLWSWIPSNDSPMVVQSPVVTVVPRDGTPSLKIHDVVRQIELKTQQIVFWRASHRVFDLIGDNNWIESAKTRFDFHSGTLQVEIVPRPVWAYVQHHLSFVALTAAGERLNIEVDPSMLSKEPRHMFVDASLTLSNLPLRSFVQNYERLESALTQYRFKVSQYWVDHLQYHHVYLENGIRVDWYDLATEEIPGRLEDVLARLRSQLSEVKGIQFISAKKAVVSLKSQIL
jgi:hypothetical protein